jgi:hypothetical protein
VSRINRTLSIFLAAEQRPAIAHGETVGKLEIPFKPQRGGRKLLFYLSYRNIDPDQRVNSTPEIELYSNPKWK